MRTVLINWYYDRYDLTKFLIDLSNEMRVVFLYKHCAVEEPYFIKDRKNVSVIYWGNYKSPKQILDSVKPDVVVFADIEAFNHIALNIAARNRGIPTIVLQHGFRGAFEVDEALALRGRPKTVLNLSSTSSWSMYFLLNSLSLKNVSQILNLFRFVISRKKGELTSALYNNKFELRRADRYIEFSEENTGYYKMRDGIPIDRFVITGNPFFDPYFEYLNKVHEPVTNSYCLLIDCPFLEANFLSDHGVSLENKNEYLKKLSSWCRAYSLYLKVKLHPASYESIGLYEDENIEYLKDIDLRPVIARASAVFFVHYSSITPLILAYKPAIYFHIGLESHKRIYEDIGVSIFNIFTFEIKNPILENAVLVDRKKLVRFLYAMDGKAGERIKNILKAQ